ncbi:DUF1642 domain-containing protein [Lacticaseibacillus rhamnosus]|uniref:DUF1642 domain-containing protein n=1 Tax=Lacticaseibacillus rhamnosus TaxID=47715 RepID=UPI0007E1D324|nr:DUF1642 domain-containing protein [Lacticaseibacillus rhamnosus]OAU76068.1 hypothetical protein PY62_10105 [Lacticaseibacillus rhamnosus]
MSNETKQDVFNALMADMSHGSEQWRARYDAAFPDNLPVIPKAVGEWLRNCKRQGLLITRAMSGRGGKINEVMPIEVVHWIAGSQSRNDTFARAWVLEAWQVEETGEVVRL